MGTVTSWGHPTPAHREGAPFTACLETSSPKPWQDGEAGPCTPRWQGLCRLCDGAQCSVSVPLSVLAVTELVLRVLHTLGVIQHG